MTIDPRNRRLRTIALGAAVLGAAGTVLAHPAAAAGVITAVTTVSCSVTGAHWCISGNNTSSGIGVIGTSKTGTGLRGTSTSQYGLKATSVTGTAILAQSTSGAAGISATTAANGYGVYATATSNSGGTGIFGQSQNGYGVYGQTAAGTGYGVAGSASSNGVGTYGYSAAGMGVQGYSPNIGIRGGGNIGIVGNGGSIGVLADSLDYPLIATSDGNNVFLVDGNGNVYFSGTLVKIASARGGAKVTSFTPNAAQPTLEDTGTAQLVAGTAAVRLDPTFAASIDQNSAYRVVVTPNGDTRGLFVATKTLSGFVVREAQGGRSTVTFDYRIVATVAGKAGQRMAAVSAVSVGPAVAKLAPLLNAAPPIPKLPSAPSSLP